MQSGAERRAGIQRKECGLSAAPLSCWIPFPSLRKIFDFPRSAGNDGVPFYRCRRGIAAFLMAALLMAGAVPAQAARFSGAYMLKICGVGPDGNEISPGAHAACQSYIAGVLDYHNMLRSMKIAPEINVCIPETVTMNELHLIVLKYFQKNPQHDSFVAAPAVLLALYAKYPCATKKKK